MRSEKQESELWSHQNDGCWREVIDVVQEEGRAVHKPLGLLVEVSVELYIRGSAGITKYWASSRLIDA